MADMHFFEDFHSGQVIDLGTKVVTAAEIVAFAREFDPQPMHVDEAAGRRSLLGGLAASGWHTCAMFMRLLCDHLLLKAASLGSPGIDRVRWLRPVRPGDTLAASGEVMETRASRSRPEIGIVRFRFTVVNQLGEPVMTVENPILFARRPAAP